MFPYLLSSLFLGCTPSTSGIDHSTETGSAPRVDVPADAEALEIADQTLSSCADPLGRTHVKLSRVLVAEAPTRIPPDDVRSSPRGVVAADFDQDGAVDFLVPQMDDLMWLAGGPEGWSEVSSGLPAIDFAIGGAPFDVDGDSDLDVVLTRFYTTPILLENRSEPGQIAFVVAEAALQPPGPPACSESVAMADLDLDGDLDLFIGGGALHVTDAYGVTTLQPCASLLLERTDTGWLDRSAELSADVQLNKVLAATWLEVDEDRFPELYVITDIPEETPGNRLLDNDGRSIWQLDGSSLETKIAGMGVATGDVNGDGLEDVAVTGTREIRLFMSNRDLGSWVDYAFHAGLVPNVAAGQIQGWGLAFEDLDNDGDLDVPIVYGQLEGQTQETPLQPDAIYLQVGTNAFANHSGEWDWNDPFIARGLAVIDVNHDGWLDLAKREIGGMLVVDQAACGPESWLELTLHDPDQANTYGVGAKVEVFAGNEVYRRWVRAGSMSHASGVAPTVHVGLGYAEHVDAVVVTWPDGKVGRIEHLDARMRVRLARQR